MRIDQSVIDEIKNKTDILDLVSEYVKLEKEDAIISVCVLFMMKKHPHLQFQKINKFVIVLDVKKVVMFFNLRKKLKTYHLLKL